MIEYLIIGNVTKDLRPDGSVPGGTALYAAVTAQRLGMQAALLTRVPDEKALRALLPGVMLHVLPTEQPSTFENRYRGNHRTQYISHVAAPLTVDDLPEAWRDAPIVHLGPIAHEADYSLLPAFPSAQLCATPQGWMRKWDAEGIVSYAPLPNPKELLKPIDLLVFSAEDVEHDPVAVQALIDAVPIAVVTEAWNGAVIHRHGEARHIPARPANVVDPTGAGDVFATAYFARFYECQDPYEAARFANVVASFSIEGVGIQAIPSRERVDAWLAEHRATLFM